MAGEERFFFESIISSEQYRIGFADFDRPIMRGLSWSTGSFLTALVLPPRPFGRYVWLLGRADCNRRDSA